MFESARVDTKGGAAAASSLATSLLVQTGLVAGIVVASVLAPVAIPVVPELDILPPAPRLRDAVRLVRTPESGAASRSSLPAVARRVYAPNFTRDAASAGPARAVDFGDAPLVIGSGPVGSPDGIVGMPETAAPSLPPPPPVKVEAPKRIAIGGDVLAARILNRPTPVYPPLARQMRLEGVVRLHGVISKTGKIADLRVVSGHPFLVKAALEAVAQWTYSPTYLNGQPIEVEAPIEVRFVLGR